MIPKQKSAYCGLSRAESQKSAYCGLSWKESQKRAYCGLSSAESQKSDFPLIFLLSLRTVHYFK